MDLDWRSIAGVVAPLAPKLGGLLGTSLGGPLGGIAGSIAGNFLASKFGVEPTPEAVGRAIAEDPRAAARLEKLEAEHADALIQQAQVEIARLTQQGDTDRANIEGVGETMRAELGAVQWWHWRHLLGYVPVALGIETAALVPLMMFGKFDPAAVTAMMGAITPPLTIFSGLLGYVAQDTTRQKIVQATGVPAPTMTDTMLGGIKSLAGKVTGKR
jgi:hypothetical protein